MVLLPIPPLNQTLERTLQVVSPLLSPAEYQTTVESVDEFRDKLGPNIQDELEVWAEQEEKRGTSWLSRLWQSTYLAVRDPLQQTTNVGFQLDWASPRKGVSLAADVAAKLSATFLQYLRGEAPREVSARGAVLSASQWVVLRGGVRVPRKKRDVFEVGAATAADRHIMVLRNGLSYSLQVSDSSGKGFTPSALEAALEWIMDDAREQNGDFTDLSHLGAADSVAILETLLEDPANRSVQDAVREALFVLDLSDAPLKSGPAPALRDLTFSVGDAYVTKPLSFQVGLEDGFVGVNVEHTMLDGATLNTVVQRARATEVDGGPRGPSTPVRLAWEVDPILRKAIRAGMVRYERAVAPLRVVIKAVPFSPKTSVPFSLDGAMQWVLLYASLATWGQVRSTYEAVDMREYTGGRTESFRPHTKEAIAFVRGLMDGSATDTQFRAAGKAHSALIKEAKTGNGIERHLFGLHEMSTTCGVAPEIFESPGYLVLTTNFLSTSSLGIRGAVVRFAFAPPMPEGVGVNYTGDEGEIEYCLTFNEDLQSASGDPNLDRFAAALREGAQALSRFLESMDG